MRGLPTPLGVVERSAAIRPGVWHLELDSGEAMGCHVDTAAAFLPDAIRFRGTLWKSWLLFRQEECCRIYRLWPYWQDTLEQRYGIMTAAGSPVSARMRR